MAPKNWLAVGLFASWAALIVACGGGGSDGERAVDGTAKAVPPPGEAQGEPGEPQGMAQIPQDKASAKPEPKKERQWVKVGQWSGSGPKKTERFQSETGELSIAWAAKPTNQFGGLVQIYAKGTDAFNLHLVANQSVDSDTAQDSNLVHSKPGFYYLDMNTANASWVVEVYDWRVPIEAEPPKETERPAEPITEAEPSPQEQKPDPAEIAKANAERKKQDEKKAAADREKKAAGKLRLAEQLLKRGEANEGKEWLLGIVKDFPGTKAAESAQKRLDGLK